MISVLGFRYVAAVIAATVGFSHAAELKPTDCTGEAKGGRASHATFVSFVGPITVERVETFLTQIDFEGVTKLIINSSGGDGASGMRFGAWVKERNLDVEVRGICLSACANYIFPAGSRKVICQRSLVTWHGSIEQKDVRELQMRYGTLLLKAYEDPTSLTVEEKRFLAEYRERYKVVPQLRETQARLFDSFEVNEYITRLGQEPTDYGIDSWTATVEVMEKFGIRNVAAPPGYGTASYVKAHGLVLLGGKYLTFGLDANGRIRRLDEQ